MTPARYSAEDLAALAMELREPLYRVRLGVGAAREVARDALEFLTAQGWMPPPPAGAPTEAPARPEAEGRHLAAVPDGPLAAARQPLTDLQRTVLAEVAAFIEKHGYSPTVREVGELVDLSTTTVHYQLKQIERAGYVVRTRGQRTLTVVDGAGAGS